MLAAAREDRMGRYTLVTLAMISLLGSLAGCDSKAKASDPGPRAETKSKEYESCGATMHCQDDTRCFEHTCRRTTRSAVGDYFAALGAQQRTNGEVEAAIVSYTNALGHYASEKIALPPDVDCAYGAALAAGKGNKEHAELGARVLHRCMLAVPVGSALRDRALAALATLDGAGLDPLKIGLTGPADVYLTRAPQAPATDKLTVDVKANPAVTGKTYSLIPDKLAEPDMKSALVACWQGYNAATHKDVVTSAIGMKVSYTPSEYEDEAGAFSIKIDPPVTLPPGPEQTADQCVRAVVEPALKDLKIRDAFTTKLTVTIK
jgi:hypothetical protein